MTAPAFQGQRDQIRRGRRPGVRDTPSLHKHPEGILNNVRSFFLSGPTSLFQGKLSGGQSKGAAMTLPLDLTINPATYAWSTRAFQTVERHLGLKVRLHDDCDCLTDGQIFLFNHFARFETIIPPYLTYSKLGLYSRSVADADLFTGSAAFTRWLTGVGAVPNDMPDLLAFLATEILHGRKVVFFPEGGMVKDRKVIDREGQYGVFSRSARRRRAHHRGASVLALMLEIFKSHLRQLADDGNEARLEHWRAQLDLPDRAALLAAAARPTLVIPGNITFHPLRGIDQALRRVVDLFAGDLPRQFSEELLVESTILFRDTDMDIRFAPPLRPAIDLWWWERTALQKRLAEAETLAQLFTLRRSDDGRGLSDRLLLSRLNADTTDLRDQAARAMYGAITINLGHLAARLTVALVNQNRNHIPMIEFRALLYRTLKILQGMEGVHLHDSLANPERYAPLPEADSPDLIAFIETAQAAGLMRVEEACLALTETLCVENTFDEIRLGNPVMVLENEAAPVWQVREAVSEAIWSLPVATPSARAHFLLDDEKRALEGARARYCTPEDPVDRVRFAPVNGRETATADPAPFLLLPPDDIRKPDGVLLVHGFLASPAEMRSLGERLVKAGHPVYGVRLPGHGTSPWDLRERTWQSWLAAVRRGASILRHITPSFSAIGFSTGGTLSLIWAAEKPEGLIGLAAIAPPVVFRSRAMALVPLVHGLNRVAEWGMMEDGILPFRDNTPEHPDVNYSSVPVRALQELRGLITETMQSLPRIDCPVLLMQGDADPVVHPQSAEKVFHRLTTVHRQLITVSSRRHGIIYENTANCHETLVTYIEDLARRPQDILLPPPGTSQPETTDDTADIPG